MKHKIIFSMLAVLLIAGCVNFGGTQQAAVDTTNIITLTPASISVIPKPPISADTDFTVTFEIKNQEKTKSIKANVNLFDWGVCKGQEAETKPVLDCRHPAADKKQECSFDLVPQQTELVEIEAKAPSKEEIGGIAASCPMQWRATYSFSTTSSAGFNVVSKSKLTELQRAGKEVEVPATSANIGTGPVKPYITFSVDQNYVTSGAPIQMKVQVKDQGEGSYTEISEGSLSITVPLDWIQSLTDTEKTSACGTDKFNYATDETKKTATFANTHAEGKQRIIPLISRQTPEIVCNFKAPDLGAETPQKSYNVIVKLENYEYSIDGKQVIEIKP